jgi:hypothetical protein
MFLKDQDSGQFGLKDTDVGLRMAGLWVGEIALRAMFQTFARAVGLENFHLPDMDAVAKAGHSHYNQELRGGEGHMEVAKLILNTTHNKAHMTLSVKPFGCMPSSGVSDGVQSVITELFPEAIFCAVETSGEGAVNFYSRVQLFLFKARQRAQQELNDAYAQYGITRAQAQQFLAGSSYGSALYKAPHTASGSSADLIHEIGPLVGKSKLGQARVHVTRSASRLKDLVVEDGRAVLESGRRVAPYVPAVLRWAAKEGLSMIPALTQNLQTNIKQLLTPTAEQQAEIARAQAAELAPPADVVQLGKKRPLKSTSSGAAARGAAVANA